LVKFFVYQGNYRKNVHMIHDLMKYFMLSDDVKAWPLRHSTKT